ncbi:hypothetical protein O181_058863 [Austropuccinia psidii MF-1]|uniref:Uncharacterized protein n=1 Tax=Austropuccinia psidii MF-1 TaxID=1389203 RepID=A0A9Q3EHR4_9BASI|nr:hypothetical protein [Austropuccinia psidii MF-1]
MVIPSIGHPSSNLPSKTPVKRLQSQVTASAPRNFQPILSTIPSYIPPPSPRPSTSRPTMASPLRPSPIPHSRQSPIVNSHKQQPVASSSRRREDLLKFLFPAAQEFQRR